MKEEILNYLLTVMFRGTPCSLLKMFKIMINAKYLRLIS